MFMQFLTFFFDSKYFLFDPAFLCTRMKKRVGSFSRYYINSDSEAYDIIYSTYYIFTYNDIRSIT